MFFPNLLHASVQFELLAHSPEMASHSQKLPVVFVKICSEGAQSAPQYILDIVQYNYNNNYKILSESSSQKQHSCSQYFTTCITMKKKKIKLFHK